MRLSRLFTATAALVVLAAAQRWPTTGGLPRRMPPPGADRGERPVAAAGPVLAGARRTGDRPHPGGIQAAINQVVWDGGDTLVPLPGERRARELGTAARAPSDDCRYYQFCTYYNRDFTGIESRMQSCTLHIDRAGIFGSYRNEQTPGTRARSYNSGYELIATTQPAPFRNTVDPFLASATFYIRPC